MKCGFLTFFFFFIKRQVGVYSPARPSCVGVYSPTTIIRSALCGNLMPDYMPDSIKVVSYS